jgi:hypothetical protein
MHFLVPTLVGMSYQTILNQFANMFEAKSFPGYSSSLAWNSSKI